MFVRVRCVWWFLYNGQARNVLGLSERQLPGKKEDRKGLLIIEALLQVGATYESSEIVTLNDVQDTAWLA